MNILILDDDDSRHEKFRNIYAGNNVTHSYSYRHFIKCLEISSPWDLIHLDYDLNILKPGDKYFDKNGMSEYYTGEDAAAAICGMKNSLLPTHVIVQSTNQFGGPAIFDILRKRGVSVRLMPFDQFYINV